MKHLIQSLQGDVLQVPHILLLLFSCVDWFNALVNSFTKTPENNFWNYNGYYTFFVNVKNIFLQNLDYPLTDAATNGHFKSKRHC